MSRTMKLAGQVLASVVVLVAGAALLAGVIVPRLSGATPFTVVTGSMEPALPPGSLAVTRPQESITTGDIITFLRSADGAVITHRVVGVGVSTDGRIAYTTRGDANNVADPGVVRPEQVHGVVWYHVPHLGTVASALGTQKQAVATGVAVLLVGYAAWQVGRALRERAGRAGREPKHRQTPAEARDRQGSAAPVSPALAASTVRGDAFQTSTAPRSTAAAERSWVPDRPDLSPAGPDTWG